MSSFGPCMCGAPDCPSCGPTQGYTVLKRWDNKRGRYVYYNPEDGDDEEVEYGDDRDEDAESGKEY